MEHFCQPTSVAVLPSGEIVVADGYCNNRIVLFDKSGNPKYSIGERTFNIINVKFNITVNPKLFILILKSRTLLPQLITDNINTTENKYITVIKSKA